MHRWLAVRRSPAVLLAALLAASVVAAGCGSGGGGGGGAPTLTSIAVGPAPISVARGASLQLRATGTWSDGSTTDVTAQSTWNSTVPIVASVSGSGLLTGQEIGAASITASSSGVTGTGPATVTSAGLARIDVTPAPSFALPAGGARQLTATGTYGDGSTANLTAQVAWTSSAEAVATVTTAGLAAVSPGAVPAATAIVTAALSGKSGTSTVTVSAVTLTGIAVAPRTPDVIAGQGLQLSATASWSDGTTADVTARATWTSTTPATVAVDASGRATSPRDARVGDRVAVAAALGSFTGSSTIRVVRGAPIGPTRTSDPLAEGQWYLLNTGQDAWSDKKGTPGVDLGLQETYDLGLTGFDVKVAIIDTGLEIEHEDLKLNVRPGSWNFGSTPPSNNPTSTRTQGDHGTSVAGIVSMVYDNGKGGMGVAPGTRLNGYAWLDSLQLPDDYVKCIGNSSSNPRSIDVAIFNQSLGTTNPDQPRRLDAGIEPQYALGVATLRGGRGGIYVKSAGNGFTYAGTADCTEAKVVKVTCMNASADPRNVWPYNIVVGAINASGVRASYSTAGSALWVSAPGGESGYNANVTPGRTPDWYEPAMVTTDQSSCDIGNSRTGVLTSSFDQGVVPQKNTTCNYRNTMNGTSSAAPATSGAIALLLDARPDLTWRDVKHILASKATKIDPSREALTTVDIKNPPYTMEMGWITNDAGYNFHPWYGFGAVNVDAALAMARTYVANSLGTFTTGAWVASGTLARRIPDWDSTGVTETLVIPASQGIGFVEAVQIRWSATHPRMADLGVELTSPKGTKSILFNIKGGFIAGAEPSDMLLLSNAFYGENPVGTWTVKVVDGRDGEEGFLTGWQIRIFGH